MLSFLNGVAYAVMIVTWLTVVVVCTGAISAVVLVLHDTPIPPVTYSAR
jgi:hypothetical protein